MTRHVQRRPGRAIVVAVALLIFVGPVIAEIRVYSNADLKPFAVGSETPAPVAEPEARDRAAWEFVQSFIDREYARLDSERSLELERARTAAEIESYGGNVDRYSVGYLPYYRGQRVKHHHGDRRPGARTSHRVVPLHARPTLMDVRRAQAQRYKGVDAVPK